MAICRYCKDEKKLIKAHIVPKSFYDKDRLEESVSIASDADQYLVKIPKGYYDSEILCAECDAKLGLIEQEATINLLRGEFEVLYQNAGRCYPQADVGMTRLFAIAVAWKASISNLPPFANINCGPYEDSMLKVLKGDSPHPEIDVTLAEYDNPSPPLLNPSQSKWDGINVLTFYAARFIFYVKLDKRPMPKGLNVTNLADQQQVYSVIRSWDNSKEKEVMLKMAKSANGIQKQVAYWKRTGKYPT